VRVEVDVLSLVGRRGSGSGCLAVLVDETGAGGVSSDRLAGPELDDLGAVWRALAEAAVGPVRVVVLDVSAYEVFELSAIPDEGAVAELAADGADPSFCIRVRDWSAGRRADDRRAVGAEGVVEAGDELAGTVADTAPDRSLGTHHKVARGFVRARP